MSNSEFSPNQTFEEYSERFKDYFIMKRENGILELRMHDDGGSTLWKKEHNHGWAAVLRAIGNDPGNEVLIYGGTGDVWTSGMDMEYVQEVIRLQREEPEAFGRLIFDTYQRVAKTIQAFFYDLDIPTISVINGPAEGHLEFAFFSDYSLCASNVRFSSSHFVRGMVPGDGTYLALQYILGPTRANHLTITGEEFSARQAHEWGMIGELVDDQARIYGRAWEIAQSIMQRPRAVRRMTHEIMRRRGRRFFTDEYNFQAAAQAWSGTLQALR